MPHQVVQVARNRTAAQKIPGQPKKGTKPSPVPRQANVSAGTLVLVDTEAATLTIKPGAGREAVYRYTEKTRMLREKKPVEIAAFKSGETVVVRFRKSSVGPPTLYDLTDNASWIWLSRVRRETTRVTIREITGDELRAVEGEDEAEIAYRITEKTLWGKGGEVVSADDFTSGERVYVVPRLLPGGGVMAIAVSDAPGFAARLKERTRPTITGTVQAFDLAKKTLFLRSAAGDDRELVVGPDCLVRWTTRDMPLSVVRPGQNVTVHLRRNEEGEQVVVRITIHSSLRPPRHRQSPSRPGSVR